MSFFDDDFKFEDFKFDDEATERLHDEEDRYIEMEAEGTRDDVLKLAILLAGAHTQLIRIQMECDGYASDIARAAIAKIEEGLSEFS